jgi:hypothetical protein
MVQHASVAVNEQLRDIPATKFIISPTRRNFAPFPPPPLPPHPRGSLFFSPDGESLSGARIQIEGNEGPAMVPGREGDFTTQRIEREVTMTTSKQSKASRAARITTVVAGIQKHFLSLVTMMLGNTSFTPAALITLLQGDIAASNKATATRSQLTTDVDAAKQSHQTVDPLLRFLRAFVIGQFGDTEASASILGDFAMAPRKARSTNVDAKAQAKAQAKATRVARNTMGPKEKAKVKGVVPAAQPTGNATVTAPATPVASTAPAPAKV